MKCPVCDTEMKPVSTHGIEVDFCPNCKGVWFDSKEMEKLSDSIEEFNIVEPRFENMKLEDDMDEGLRQCPRCKSTMSKVTINGKPPVFDYCPNDCGYWFDDNEVKEYVKNNMITARKTESYVTEIFENTK